jgi:hypothetical protein
MLNPKHHISVEGRGTGKSFDVGFTIDKLVRHLPKGVCSLTGQTFGQLLTRTLPSSLKLLQQIGYQKDVNFVVGKTPPRYFDSSYEEINQFKNFISFSNGFRLALISQNDPGSGRGCNLDFEMTDETLTIKKEQYDHEVSPANRGNLEFFGKYSDNPVSFHHGSKHSTSMPPTKEGRWVLDYAKYYEEEKGIQLFNIWNRIVKMQLDLLDITDKKQFAELWNEIARMRAKIAPFVSKDGVLFTLANGFDNIEMLGLSYIKEQRSKMPSLIFLIEIMNYLFDKIEDCFYNIIESKHIYYNGSDDALMMLTASESNFDFDKFNLKASLYDRDCDPNVPLEIVPDWQGAISLFCVCQERNFDFVHNTVSLKKCFNFINEFYVKPDASGRRRPVEIKNSEFLMDIDTVIVAIGNGSNPLISQTTAGLTVNKYGNIVVDENGKSSIDGIYAGGDIVLGAATVILAMGEGRRAAASMNAYLAGKPASCR